MLCPCLYLDPHARRHEVNVPVIPDVQVGDEGIEFEAPMRFGAQQSVVC